MKASILAVAAVICLLSLLVHTSLASSHHHHQDKHHEKSSPTNSFNSSNLVRFSYSTSCPKKHGDKHHGDKHHEDKSLTCREEKYVFDRTQTLVSRATKSSTKYALISPEEFEQIAHAVSFYQGESINEKPKEKETDSTAKHEVKIYWDNHVSKETAIQNGAEKRTKVFMDLGKMAESSKYSYHESQGNSNQDNLDKVIAEIVGSKKWVDIPTNPNQIECIKWIRMIAKNDKDIGLIEKYLFFSDRKVKHVMFVESLTNSSLQSISSEPLTTEYGRLKSDYLIQKTMQAAIDSNIFFADSVYGHQDAGDRGIVVQLNWYPQHSHKTSVKNITIWDYNTAPENVKSFEFNMRVLKSDVDYSKEDKDDSNSNVESILRLFTTNLWQIVSYGFSAFLLLFGVGFVVRSLRRNRGDDDEGYKPVDQSKKAVVFVKEDEEALIGENSV